MRILFVTARPPWPPRRGDQARAAGWLAGLGERHAVRLLALQPAGFAARPFPANVGGRTVPLGRLRMLAGLLRHPGMPGQVALHAEPRLLRAFASALAEFRPDVVVAVLSRVGWLFHRGVPVPAVVDLVDSLELNLKNRARRDPLLGPLLAWEARRMGAWDAGLLRRTAAGSVVSERDRRSLVARDASLAAKLAVVPFGIEVGDSLPTVEKAGDVVLLSGNLGYFPTVDGACWFAERVWPRIRARRPGAEWWLAGARPARRVRRLAALDGVRLLADPEDLGAIRRAAAVSVVPLRSGSGTPIKVLEALADGVPVVTSPLGQEGLDEIEPGAVAVAEDEEAFADEVLGLLDDGRRADAKRRLGWEWVRVHHALPHVVARFESLLERARAGDGLFRPAVAGDHGGERP